ncbi:MAG: MarR family transcriptional regulator [Erythrobacter sp.]|uniref:winged helix DNA-binding protein n=1 Tax=Erythrobacter sp. TaxID=1042 RepID=UPI0025E533F7|nr:winged helix DNA-binding protein [Erythrobacter sp.]MCM0001224.1 MarR family transcriptional regulator [Erythrobacter sp.]
MGEMRHDTGQVIAGAGMGPGAGLGHGDAALLFHPLADELMAIASRLREAAEGGARGEPADPAAAGAAAIGRPARPARSHLALARKTYALRRKRASLFGNPDLFGEPAWDILLDLYIAAGEGKPVSVSSACIGSAAPATTGLRWLGVLAQEGLVVRENDAEDHRRVLVRLTPSGQAAMDRFFDAVD